MLARIADSDLGEADDLGAAACETAYDREAKVLALTISDREQAEEAPGLPREVDGRRRVAGRSAHRAEPG